MIFSDFTVNIFKCTISWSYLKRFSGLNVLFKFSELKSNLDVELMYLYTDNRGNQFENPRHLRKSEKVLARLQLQVSRRQKRSNNRKRD